MESEERVLERDVGLARPQGHGTARRARGAAGDEPLEDERVGRRLRRGGARRVEERRARRRRDPDASGAVDEAPLVAGGARKPLVRAEGGDLEPPAGAGALEPRDTPVRPEVDGPAGVRRDGEDDVARERRAALFGEDRPASAGVVEAPARQAAARSDPELARAPGQRHLGEGEDDVVRKAVRPVVDFHDPAVRDFREAAAARPGPERPPGARPRLEEREDGTRRKPVFLSERRPAARREAAQPGPLAPGPDDGASGLVPRGEEDARVVGSERRPGLDRPPPRPVPTKDPRAGQARPDLRPLSRAAHLGERTDFAGGKRLRGTVYRQVTAAQQGGAAARADPDLGETLRATSLEEREDLVARKARVGVERRPRRRLDPQEPRQARADPERLRRSGAPAGEGVDREGPRPEGHRLERASPEPEEARVSRPDPDRLRAAGAGRREARDEAAAEPVFGSEPRDSFRPDAEEAGAERPDPERRLSAGAGLEERVHAEAGERRAEVDRRETPPLGQLRHPPFASRHEARPSGRAASFQELPDPRVGKPGAGRHEPLPVEAGDAPAVSRRPERPVRGLEQMVDPAGGKARGAVEHFGDAFAPPDRAALLAAEPETPVPRADDGAHVVRHRPVGHVERLPAPSVETRRAVLSADPEVAAAIECDRVDRPLREAVAFAVRRDRGAGEIRLRTSPRRGRPDEEAQRRGGCDRSAHARGRLPCRRRMRAGRPQGASPPSRWRSASPTNGTNRTGRTLVSRIPSGVRSRTFSS